MNTEVIPNAKKLIDSMRYLGYDNKSAICDIIDNSIDANAKRIWLNVSRIDNKEFIIEIIDDGIGMNEHILSQALRFGSITERSTRADLGRFGMGLTTASISMGKNIQVITKAENGKLLSAVLDLDYMIDNNKFELIEFAYASSEVENEFKEKLGDSASGTIIKITKTDGFSRKYIGSFAKEMSRELGQVYRYFIREPKKYSNTQVNLTRLQMFINGELIKIHDPLWLDHQDTDEYVNDLYDIKYRDSKTGVEKEESIRIRIVILPEHGGRAENKKAGYTAEKAGFYILRNNREIASAQTLGLISRHPDFIRVRGEIFITGALDDVIGIEFTKRDVKPAQAIKDQLQNHIGGDIKSIRKRIKKVKVNSNTDNTDFNKVEKYISSMSRLLLRPEEKNDINQQVEFEKNEINLEGEVLKEDYIDGVCKFSTANFGEEGPIYSAEQRGKIIYIELNSDHPFYRRFIMENQDSENRDKVMAAYYLIYSMAAAELRTFDEEQEAFIMTFKSILSINLRTLLANK